MGKLHKEDRPISKATISLFNPKVDAKDPAYKVATAVTNGNGQYSLNNVKPGVYTLAITIDASNIDDLPCKASGAFALDKDTWATDLVLAPGNGSGILAITIEKVQVVAGKATERDINLSYCQ